MTPQSMDKSMRLTRRVLGLTCALVVLLIVGNLLLVLKISSQTNQVVLIPTQVSDGMVARGSVDKAYLEAVAMDAVYAMYNTSADTVEYGRSTLSRISAPDRRDHILGIYDDNAEDIRERKITTVFFPRVIEHNFKTYEVVIEGALATYLETLEVHREDRRILVKFAPQAGSVRLVSIGKLISEG